MQYSASLRKIAVRKSKEAKKMTDIPHKLALIRAEIEQIVSETASNERTVDLLAVSKGHRFEKILSAAKAGQEHFGENYLQDALPKIQLSEELHLNLSWHYIGQIQSNKTRAIAKHFDWCQSLSSLKHARLLDKHRQELHAGKPLQVCVQVQFEENEKRGGLQFEQLDKFIKELPAYTHLNLRGLMCVMPQTWDGNKLSDAYKKLQKLFLTLKSEIVGLDTLSCGMSSDYTLAIQHGSTMIRLGTAIFGTRQ